MNKIDRIIIDTDRNEKGWKAQADLKLSICPKCHDEWYASDGILRATNGLCIDCVDCRKAKHD